MNNTPEWPTPEAGGTPNPQGGGNPGPGAYPPPGPGMNTGGTIPPQAPNYSYAAPGVPLVQGNGKVSVFATIGKSFSLFGGAIGPWIGMTAIFGTILLVVIGVSMLPASMSGELQQQSISLSSVFIQAVIVSMATAFMTVYLGNGALQAVEGRALTFKQFFVLKHGLQKPVYVAFIVYFIYQIFNGIGQWMLGMDTSAMYLLGAIVMLAGFIATPILWLAYYYSLDHGYGLGDSLSHCVSDSLRNFFPLLGLLILVTLMSLISAIPLGLGLLVMIPVYSLAGALAYRQISRGVHVAL